MATQADEYNTLEALMLSDDIGEPLRLKLSLLQTITNDFSEKQIIGSGGYATVYMGMLGDDIVAVKKFYSFNAIEDETFQREVDCLMRIRHCNIVCFVGYCAETSVTVKQEGVKNVFVESREKLLCFEYLRNGSLRKHLTEKPCKLQWKICYQIIKGICLGLHYLHEKHIIHLDLKPENILLDDSMVPKIADFGLSRLLGDEKSRMVTKRKHGTRGYMAPEYLVNGDITVKSDIYSLGLIIKEILMGPNNTGTTTTENTMESWRHRLEQDSLSPMRQTPLEIRYRQIIEACMEISETCTEPKPEKRPTTGEILWRLEKAEAGDRSIVTTTPAEEWISSLSRLMGSMRLVAATPSSQQPSTQGEGSNGLQPRDSKLAWPKGPEDRSPDKSFWLDTTSNAKCYMLSSRLLKITWGENPNHWKWVTLPDSRFAECAELQNVYWLAVIGEIATEDLTPGTRYTVYLVYKLTDTAIGLKGGQESSIRLYGERIVCTNKVNVDPAARRMAGVAHPLTRGDGWMELKLAEFATDENMLTEKAVIVHFREENDHVRKSGLIIEGMEFRPNK